MSKEKKKKNDLIIDHIKRRQGKRSGNCEVCMPSLTTQHTVKLPGKYLSVKK